MIAIGIDPGVKTGFAVVHTETPDKFMSLKTYIIHEAMSEVKHFIESYGAENVVVFIEDARRRRWYGKSGREKLQGAGSIKRDCKIWEDYLTDLNATYLLVAPEQIATKLPKEQFRNVTKHVGVVSQHARDAGMLVYGLSKNRILNYLKSKQ